MITALVSGKLNRDAESKESAKGTAYALLIIRTEDGSFIRCNLFGDDVQGAARLKKGDEVAVTGRLDVGVWERDGKPMPSMSLMANRVVSNVL